jgi:hypothetical protein
VLRGGVQRVLKGRPPFIRRRRHMLWTILVIIVIVLAVIGFFTVVRGRA